MKMVTLHVLYNLFVQQKSLEFAHANLVLSESA